MSIKEQIKQSQDKAYNKILEALCEFTENTGLVVDRVNLTKGFACDGYGNREVGYTSVSFDVETL